MCDIAQLFSDSQEAKRTGETREGEMREFFFTHYTSTKKTLRMVRISSILFRIID